MHKPASSIHTFDKTLLLLLTTSCQHASSIDLVSCSAAAAVAAAAMLLLLLLLLLQHTKVAGSTYFCFIRSNLCSVALSFSGFGCFAPNL
jgi:hypothetical protein